MAFIDNLALIEVLLGMAAVVLAYGGVLSWWAIRTNNPKGLRGVLKGMAIPIGAVGLISTIIAIWGEFTWPFPAASHMAGYNIFFFDALMLFGIVLIAYAAAAYFNARMQFVGVLALVAGGATAFYGWTGYTANPAFTKDPFDTFLLYSGFAAAGVFAFPSSVIIDYFLGASDAGRVPFAWSGRWAQPFRGRLGSRAAQPITPTAGSEAKATTAVPTASALAYRVPYWVQMALLLFPVFMALAALAALWYFGTTLPGHLGAGPGAAP